jgi:tetratricopeptide (TPR) repeat protein
MSGADDDRVYGFAEFRPQEQQLRIPAFELNAGTREGDLAGFDRRMDELARRTAAAASESALVLESPVLLSAELALMLGDDGADLLADARANVADGQYELALEQLDEYLEISPDHAEARYLRAYCRYRQGGDGQLEALRILRPLRDETLQDELSANVAQLRTELLRLLTPGEIAAFMDTVRTSRDRALARLTEYIELAPEEGLPPYLVAGIQARSGDLDAAYRTATSGAAAAKHEREPVAALARSLEVALVTPLAARAVAAFKARDYQLARRELRGIGARWCDAVVVRDFDSYLAVLCERPPGGTLPAPPGPAARVDALYRLIADSDAQQVLALLDAGLAGQAALTAAQALRYVPFFPWLNFLYAASLFIQGTGQDRAAKAAEIAQRDPSITQAGELLTVIRIQQDSALLGPVLEEFAAAMDSVRGGPSAHDLDILRTRLTQLQCLLPELRAAMVTGDGVRTASELSRLVDDRLAEVSDVVAVARLFEKYDTIMSPVQGGIRDAGQAVLLGAGLRSLAAEIAKTRAAQTQSRPGLDELAGLVAARTRELDSVRVSLDVAALVSRFNRAAGPDMRNTGLFWLEVRVIRDEAKQLESVATDAQDRKLLRQLIQTIDRLLPP